MRSKGKVILMFFASALTMSATAWAQGIDNTGLDYNNYTYAQRQQQQQQALLNYIRNKQEKTIKGSRYNPYVNETLYKKIKDDISAQQVNYDQDNLRSLMAYLADSPDADCSYGKKQSGAVQYKYGRRFMAASGNYTYGIICKSQFNKNKHQVFFGGVPKSILTNELANYTLSSYSVTTNTTGAGSSGSATSTSSSSSSSGNVNVIMAGQQPISPTASHDPPPADSMYDDYMNQNRIVLGVRQGNTPVAFQDDAATNLTPSSTTPATSSLTPATIANPQKSGSQPTVFVQATH